MNSKDKVLNISTFLLINSPLAFFNGYRKLRAKKARRNISISTIIKFSIIIIDITYMI